MHLVCKIKLRLWEYKSKMAAVRSTSWHTAVRLLAVHNKQEGTGCDTWTEAPTSLRPLHCPFIQHKHTTLHNNNHVACSCWIIASWYLFTTSSIPLTHVTLHHRPQRQHGPPSVFIWALFTAHTGENYCPDKVIYSTFYNKRQTLTT